MIYTVQQYRPVNKNFVRNRYDFDILTLGTSKFSFIASIKRLKEEHGDRAELRIQFRCFCVFAKRDKLDSVKIDIRKDYVRTYKKRNEQKTALINKAHSLFICAYLILFTAVDGALPLVRNAA